ncbi:uncharacterized protein LOC132316609 [Cornus florida]|uniref:uncharacterized protein LOC132316609 n=1 Tax=Cornus florida TaxID=4283 RepID=UPI0028981293|nr:uncharacterized protein LOC132316609 [Cornus florida]
MGKPPKTIDMFFKRKNIDKSNDDVPSSSNLDASVLENPHPPKYPRVEHTQVNFAILERDPGLRRQIWEYPIGQQDEIRRAYINAKPYQIILSEYPRSVEYSPTKDAAFCLPYFLFGKKPTGHPGTNAFTLEGFRNWKKVNAGKNCAFLNHIGEGPCSPHNIAERSCKDLMYQPCHFDKVMEKQTLEQISNNRLRLKTSVDAVRWLTFQACAFRGHDECPESRNRGNFIEMVKILATYNDDVAKLVLENAPKNAKYTSPQIQKEILHVLARKVRSKIREDIGDTKFCILVDEACDESKREQMALVLRFVDRDGFLQKRFFDIMHVKDTTSLTLKNALSTVLSHYNLSVQDLRGQGYDGASNMRGTWNGLQALFLNNCPYAYYAHSLDEIETGRGANQIGSLQRPRDTRWSSHFDSVCSLIRLFGPTCSVLRSIIKDGSTCFQRGDADSAFDIITSFEFVFILHLVKDIMGASNILCEALQQKSQDILNAMHLVSTTKNIILKLREDGWNNLLGVVKSFCERHNIDVPDMSAPYTKGKGRPRHPQENITLEHHYRIDIFNGTIDSQLQELNNRFSKKAVELIVLSSALDPRDGY